MTYDIASDVLAYDCASRWLQVIDMDTMFTALKFNLLVSSSILEISTERLHWRRLWAAALSCQHGSP